VVEDAPHEQHHTHRAENERKYGYQSCGRTRSDPLIEEPRRAHLPSLRARLVTMPSSPANGVTNERSVRVLFVCLGNICRSPTAEAVMRRQVVDHGLDHLIEIDSAGTGGWHAGDPPDERARLEASRRGIEMSSKARQVHVGDFEYFDLMLAMDRSNFVDLNDLAPSVGHRDKVHLLREFDPTANGDLEVPDPYYGGPNGFTDVFDLVDASCRGLLEHIKTSYLERHDQS
jgi:protein-tyrosine phosphatase